MGHEYGLKLVPHKKIFSTTVLSIAASILVIIIAGTALLMTNRQQPQQPLAKRDKHPGNTVMRSTLRSEYKYLLLPDSTQVWLNAASTLEFPKVFDKNKRQVFLKGEAYFDVKHAEDIPFVIYTGNVSTEVLGTAFNIKAYPDLEKITVSVNRGKVKVNYENKQVAMLTKGQQVSIDKKIRKVQEKVVKEDVPSSWQQGKLMYDDYSVADIVSDLQRIYDVNINITSQQVKQMRVSTSFKREYGVESALEILCTLTDTQLNIKNGTYSIDNK
jgi:ferric-dicitrate binding protein FerR (iron transport regulator)